MSAPYMKIQNKKTGQIKYFTRRDEFIHFLLKKYTHVPSEMTRDFYKLSKEDLLEKYLPEWFDIRGID